jgi:hypothetical protein
MLTTKLAAMKLVNQSKLPFLMMTMSSIRMGSSLTTFINLKDPLLLRGKFLPRARHRESIQVVDPSATLSDIEDGTAVIALVEAMDRSDAKKSIEMSSKALNKWKFHTTALERSKMLSRLSMLITESADDIGKILVMDVLFWRVLTLMKYLRCYYRLHYF